MILMKSRIKNPSFLGKIFSKQPNKFNPTEVRRPPVDSNRREETVSVTPSTFFTVQDILKQEYFPPIDLLHFSGNPAE